MERIPNWFGSDTSNTDSASEVVISVSKSYRASQNPTQVIVSLFDLDLKELTEDNLKRILKLSNLLHKSP